MRASIISSFLPLVDSFLPAVQKVDEGTYTDITQLGEGIKSLKQQLDAILRGFNVVPIDEINVPFDYNLHDVVQTQERDDIDDHTVLNIIHVGWKIGADVIRPAKVVVSRLPVSLPVESGGEAVETERPLENAAADENSADIDINQENNS